MLLCLASVIVKPVMQSASNSNNLSDVSKLKRSYSFEKSGDTPVPVKQDVYAALNTSQETFHKTLH
jgi:hypothetical protein